MVSSASYISIIFDIKCSNCFGLLFLAHLDPKGPVGLCHGLFVRRSSSALVGVRQSNKRRVEERFLSEHRQKPPENREPER